MKTTPSGLQVVFLLFAIEFGAMLVASAIVKRVDVPEAFFSTLGNLLAYPFELTLVFAIPTLRDLVLQGLRRPLTGAIVGEAGAVVGMKLAITFGVWGAIALWGLHISLRSSDLASYGFFPDRASMDAAYFSAWGLISAGVAVTLGPVVEEILYRGVLYRSWERQWGWFAGTVLSSLVFSAIHPNTMVQTFFSAIVYACLYRRTGTLWASIVCHIGYNLAITWPLLGHVLQIKPAEAATSIGPWIPNLVCLALGALAFVTYVALAARKPAPESETAPER